MTNIYTRMKQPLEIVPTVVASTTVFLNSANNIQYLDGRIFYRLTSNEPKRKDTPSPFTSNS